MTTRISSGTSAAVAKRLGRRYIGLERDTAYAEAATARLAAIAGPADPAALTGDSKREAPRVPFGSLLERGLISPGDRLVGPRGDPVARVRADGTIVASNHLGDFRGSIHRVAAGLLGAPSCNGWTFWHLDRGSDRAVPIDSLRQQVRAELH